MRTFTKQHAPFLLCLLPPTAMTGGIMLFDCSSFRLFSSTCCLGSTFQGFYQIESNLYLKHCCPSRAHWLICWRLSFRWSSAAPCTPVEKCACTSLSGIMIGEYSPEPHVNFVISSLSVNKCLRSLYCVCNESVNRHGCKLQPDWLADDTNAKL